MNIEKIIKANNLIEEIKSAILCNTIITIRDEDTNELLWSCHTGESYGAFKKMNLKIDQDMNLYAVLDAIKTAIDKEKSC
ncbi:MAG: hypothetical protein PHW73_11920 [Atribacterota bacterium]|nr:hypothetical protein [Atribacterota bacterium]